jgi:hypothetical protein
MAHKFNLNTKKQNVPKGRVKGVQRKAEHRSHNCLMFLSVFIYHLGIIIRVFKSTLFYLTIKLNNVKINIIKVKES